CIDPTTRSAVLSTIRRIASPHPPSKSDRILYRSPIFQPRCPGRNRPAGHSRGQRCPARCPVHCSKITSLTSSWRRYGRYCRCCRPTSSVMALLLQDLLFLDAPRHERWDRFGCKGGNLPRSLGDLVVPASKEFAPDRRFAGVVELSQ